MRRIGLLVMLFQFLLLGAATASPEGGMAPVLASSHAFSVGSGSWSDPSVWSTGRVPARGAAVTINAGHSVIYDAHSEAALGDITVLGKLRFSRTTNTRLKTAGNLFVGPGSGFLDMGTADYPIPADIRAELVLVLPQGYQFVGGSTHRAEDKGLWALNGSRWEVHGAPLLRPWVKLAADAAAGQRELIVEHNVLDWYLGGSVIIAQTSNPFRPGVYDRDTCERDFGDYRHAPADEKTCNYFWENEVRTIQGLTPLSGGGTVIRLDRPLEFDHQGTGRVRGEVGLLTRNVLVRTEIEGVPDSVLDRHLAQRTFAHTMLMGTSTGKIQYAEFKYLGHLSTLARYPIHIHMTGAAGREVVVRGNSIWRSGNRGYQVHNTQGVLVEDNVAFDTVMSPYYVERTGHPGERISKTDREKTPYANWLVHNLGVQATKAPQTGQAQQNDDAIFWIDQLDQVMLGNVGVGAGANAGFGDLPQGAESPDSEFAGIWMDERSGGTGRIQAPLFYKNEMRSNANHGIAFWPQGVDPFEFADLTVSRNGKDGIKWGFYRAPHRVYQLSAIENGDDGVGSDKDNRSGTRFIQDAEFIGNRVGIMNGPNVVRPIYPDYPYTYIRVTFDGNRDANIAYQPKRPSGKCAQRGADSPIIDRNCHANYVLLLQPEFKSGESIDFVHGKDAVRNGGNKNTFWRVKGATGLPNTLPEDFLLMRPDQLDPANRTKFSREFLVGRGQRLASEFDDEALVVPVAPLPEKITPPVWGHTGSNSGGGVISEENYYTFEKAVDYPPEVSIAVEVQGTELTVEATATDDRRVTGVEFYLDDERIAADTQAPYQAGVDLSGLARRYAYVYAVAYDGQEIRHTTAPQGALDNLSDDDKPFFKFVPYLQRAYSKVIEVGPEGVVAAGECPPVLVC
ncbi:MAG: G8 domain-containing protein [Dehalococcoidia bacterium]